MMEYINQYDYPEMPYPHPEGVYQKMEPTVATSGCGLCSLCIVVRTLTSHRPTIEDFLQYAEDSGANFGVGTSMRLLAPYIAEKFGLTVERTKDPKRLLAHLEQGGMAIVLVDGDTERGVGLFSHIEHFITAILYQNGEIGILDPAWKPGKFEEEGRAGKVREEYPVLYVQPELLVADAQKAEFPFTLFSVADPKV